MRIFTLITALIICSASWISVSVSEFHTVEVQPGEEVTLLCSNFSSLPSHIFWFKLANRPNVSCVSSMLSFDVNASFCDGFQNGKFDMTSNTTALFLKIKQVNLSDSGLYFCGFNAEKKPVIVSATYLKVQVSASNGVTSVHLNMIHGLTSVILAAVTVFLIILVAGVAVRIGKPQTVDNEEQNPEQSESSESDELKDAALSFYSAAMRNGRPEAERQVETRVLYTASR